MAEKNLNKKADVNGFSLRFHLLLFIVVNLLLILINFMFSPMVLWFLYPLFGWLIAISLHIAVIYPKQVFPAKRSVILHFAAYASVNLLLSIINLLSSGSITWVLFPLIFWGTGLILHAIVYQEFLTEEKIIERRGVAKKKKSKRPFIDKVRSIQKRATLITRRAETSTEGSTKDDQIPSKEVVKGKPKIKSKGKKTFSEIPSSEDSDLSEKEKDELEKTESEVDVEEKEIFCIVHKGNIDGTVYICPDCKTYYCLKCAQTLKEKGEQCWSCNIELNP